MKINALIYCGILMVCMGCKSYTTKYPYSLEDFRPELRGYLEKMIINNGFTEETKTYLANKPSVKELRKILRCEHPVLRVSSFYILCNEKDGYNANEDLLYALDDTTIINNNQIDYSLADKFIAISRYKTTIPKDSFISLIINKYQYLQSFYYIYTQDTKNKNQYYKQLQNTLLNTPKLLEFNKSDLAYELSLFKRIEDTTFIKNILDYNPYWSKEYRKKFFLIEKSPSPNYYGVLEQHLKILKTYNDKKVLQYEYISNQSLSLSFENYISALAAYKTQKSADIIKIILKEKLYPANFQKADEMYGYKPFYDIYSSLSKYNCPKYDGLIKIIKHKALAFKSKYVLESSPLLINDNIMPETNYW